jgi:hypothetical protein
MSVNPGSTYEQTKNSRHRINNMLGFGFQQQGGSGKRCEVCQDQPKLQLKKDGGKKQWWCHGCGNNIPFDPITDDNSKYTSKYGNVAGKTQSFIISQPRKKRREDILADEDRETIAASFGSNSVELKEFRDIDPP